MCSFPSRNRRAQIPIIAVLAFSIVLVMVLVLADMAVRTAAVTPQNTREAEMEQIAIAATNDLVLNTEGGLLLDTLPPGTKEHRELADHVLDFGRFAKFDNAPESLRKRWATGSCDAAVGVYWLDGKEAIVKKGTIESGKYGKFVFRRLVAIQKDGRREPGYVKFEITC